MPTLVCVPLMVRDLPSALAEAQAAKDAGADLVEYRIDEVFSGGGGGEEGEAEETLVVRLVSESPLPCILTCRSAAEGGHYEGDDDARIALYERLGTASGRGEHPPRYIDCELETYARSANIRQKINLAIDHPEQVRDLKTSLILSIHDFAGRPADLTRRLLRLRAEGGKGAAVLKVAFRARSLRDNLELFDLLAERDRPTIALGMGEFGLMGRVLAPKFGGFLTFTSLRDSSATAPGQPTIRELLDLYRFGSIGPRTRVYGVVGWPVGHSLSPLIHNAGFEAAEHDGVYLPLPVPGGGREGREGAAGGYEAFKATLGELVDHPRLDFAGCSVTLPHKENLVRLAGELGWNIEDAARRIGAANTIAVERGNDGRVAAVRVLNTDLPAAVASLADAMGDLAGRRIGIVGAGGVARAVAAGLAGARCHVTIFNRTEARAQELAAHLSGMFPDAPIAAANIGTLAASGCEAYINCTPLGMAGGPGPDELPIPVDALSRIEPGTVIFDTVYTPLETPLLKRAREAGCRVVDGVGMFVRQAAAQSELWTGRPAPTAAFERIVREQLASTAPRP